MENRRNDERRLLAGRFLARHHIRRRLGCYPDRLSDLVRDQSTLGGIAVSKPFCDEGLGNDR